ncbi:MAG: heme-binding domain-containing protein [Bacteroidota bacterium]
MRKGIKIAGLLFILLLIILQFFRPEKNQGSITQEDDLISVANLPDSLAVILVSSCYDCHSNHTEYPWYSRISPVSWYLDKHIREGKEDLNLSEYGLMDRAEKIGALSDIYDAMEAGTMPLQSYVLIHRDARMSRGKMDVLMDWADQESLRLMKE